MVDIVPFPKTGGSSSGDGPENPMLEKRVDRLDDDVREIKRDLSEIKQLLAEIKGELKRVPTTYQLLAITFSTWAAGAGFLFLAFKFAETTAK